ncbi:hypothetical protein GGI35DRAFT_490637 [Trichoderma velutinum]
MVIDEYSSNTFWSELIDLYQATDPTVMKTPTKIIDYSQYANIYRGILESRGTSDGDWWRDVFRGYRPQPLFQDVIGNPSKRLSGYDVAADIYWKTLPQREATRLAAQKGNVANTFGAWLSLAQLFLSRVTGKTEYLLGIPTSTRSVDPRFVGVMGYCMTLAVVPVSLDLDQQSLAFEAAALEKYRQCVAHDQRLEDILSWLAEENQTENTATVDALFVYHDPLDSYFDLGNSGLQYKKLDDATGGSHYHMVLHVDNSGPSIRLVVELSCSDERRSVREIVSAAPSQALQFAVESSTRQAGPVLRELRRRGENLNILDHIYITASRNRSAIAIATAERNVTYQELLEWSSGIASKLRREGVRTGDVVALFMDKSIEYLMSVLALIHVGACFVPFDITSTPVVNNSKLAVLAPTLILTRRRVNGAVYEDESYYRKLDVSSSIRRIAISTPPRIDPPYPNFHETAPSTIKLSADAYIAFTSGSTAEPKCFRISHRALVSSICSQVEALSILSGHRVAMLTSLAFDVSLMEIFCTFVAGSTLVVAPHDQFITSLADTLRNMAVTHVIATPTMLAAIESPSEVPSLESIILGGEPIPSALYERWWGNVDIRISYGPAETTIATHDFIVTAKPTTSSCNIGRPSPSVRAIVLDEKYNPVLPGIPGRLFIGAAEDNKYDQLTSGYISPLSANKRLVDHPSLGRLYDTGDIVRYDLQGTFTLVGRTDDQVKISGVRFNIGDVEKTIDVLVGARRRCAVVVSETQPGNKALTCFIEFADTDASVIIPPERHTTIPSIILLLDNARREELTALRDRVSEALPAAMIPKFWLPVKELPVSRTGKIDRRRLNGELVSVHRHGTNIEAYSSLVAEISHPYEAGDDEKVVTSSQSLQYPTSGPVSSYRERSNDELMQSLIIAWTEILPINEAQVDIHRSFFKTGGDSVSAIRFCARVRRLGIRGCTVAKMRSNPSLSQLHDVLAYDNSSLLSNMPSSDDEPTDEVSGLTPPSSIPSTPTSSGYSFVKLPGATDFATLSISGQSIFTTGDDNEESTSMFRHVESFMNTSELVQQIAAAGINESEVDVVYPPTAMQSSMVQQSLLNSGVYHSQLILHLEGPVQEIKLRKAWSAVCNANPSLRTVFVPLERGHVPGVAYLAREHVREKSSHKRIEAALQTAILSSDFQARAEAFGVTPFTIVQLAFALALGSSWIDQKLPRRVGFWTVTSGRSHMVDDINAIGNFLNTVPCVVPLSSSTSVHECLQTTHKMFTKMSEHDCVPTPDIMRCFEKPECDIDALLVFENHPDASEPQIHFGNNIRLNSTDGREVSSLPFVVVVEPGQAEVKIIAKFDEARFHSGSLDSLTDRLAIYLSGQDNSDSKVVPIVLEKSPWMVIAMLAVLKSGRAYCPLEFDAPTHRISFAIKRLGTGLIITNENGFTKLASLSAWGHPQILVIDNIQTLLANAETSTSRDAVSLLPTLHPDMACYVMFTSGSTSSPKACTLTHGAVASAVQAVKRPYNFEPSSRILLFANYVFDASAIDIWGSLSSGSCLFLLHDDELKSDLVGHVDRLQINWIHLTPTVLRTISPDQVPSLKTIIVGGEMILPDLLNTWVKQVEVVAAYGPTEAAVQVLTFRPSRYPIDEIAYTALPGNLVVVVNDHHEICHINEPGEIMIAGKQLFVGYEGNSLATQAALTTIHGFGDFRFYKTGDRAYYSHIGEDGKPYIRILGRIDHQMKVSGMRLAPEEIEEVLNADPDVVCSAVVAGYGRSIDALVVGRSTNLNMNRLMALCREKLPERLRPIIHQVKEIPLLASRKVDRKRLPTYLNDIIATKLGGSNSNNVPQNDSAKTSAVNALIEKVLGMKVLDGNAPLADLGLDSLGFMRLKHLLCTNFHLPDLTYRQLRNIATAAGIVNLVDMASPLAVSTDPDAHWQIFSLTESIGYVGSSGAFTRYDLQCSAYVLHRLEIFRTTFEFDLSAGNLFQVVNDETLVAVQISRISHINIDDLRARFIPHNCATIDLRNGPLAIFHLIADGRTVVLHSTIHHIIVDEFTSIQLFNLIRHASKSSFDQCTFEGTSSIALHAAQLASRNDEHHLNEWKQRMLGAIGIDTECRYEDSYDQLSRLGNEDSLEDFTKQIREGVDFALESDMAINKVASACGLDTANFMIQFIVHDAQSYDDISSDMTDMTLDLIISEKPMFDLTWHVFAHKDCLDLLVEFNEQKYDKDDIKTLVHAWEKVINERDCYGGQSISSILSTIIPEESLFKKNVSNATLANQACQLQAPPPSDLTSSIEDKATSMPINISGGPNQRAMELQSLVTESLCRSLGVAVIDLDQNLREIGLDSFAAMSFIASILRVEPELEISLREISACPSVRLLVDTLAAQKDGSKPKESLCKSLGVLGLDSFSYISVSMRDVMGCTTMETLTYENKSDDGSYVAKSLPSAYHIVIEHDIFRTHFDFTDEKRLEYAIHDLSSHSDEAAAEEFDLAEGHLYIIINFHHCIADEQTISGVWEELCSVVTDKSCYKKTANADAGSYIDFSTRHHEMLKSNKLAEAQAFFQRLLIVSEVASYPDAVTINRGAIFDDDPVHWTYKSGSTPFAAYLFTFQLLLILIPATCRGPREQNLYGCFINTLPVILRDFQDCLAKILEYSDIPFERLLGSTGWGVSDFDTLFTTIEPCKGILLGVLPEMTKNGKSKLDMSVEFNPDRITEVERLGPSASLSNVEDTYSHKTTSESESHEDTKLVSKVPPWFHGTPNPIILDQARTRPSATAMIFENEISITYKEMADMISGLANYLSMPISIMTAGGAYVPIELNNPTDWNLTIIADCEPAAVVFIPETESLRAKGILCVDISTPLPTTSKPFTLTTKRLPEHLAYVLYTSGSTVSLRPLYPPWTFDVSVIDIFGTLSSWMLADLQDTMAMLRITHIATTPTIAGALDANALPDLCRDVWASKATLFNIYGPTEATVDVLGRQCFPDTDISNIGRPLENVFVYVLDDKLRQVGIGELARGYLKPPKGAAAFVDTKEYGRIYLTGDFCLGLELGAIETAVNNVLDQGRNASLQTKGSLQPLTLAASVKAKLPAYFMPSLWVPSLIGELSEEALDGYLPHAATDDTVMGIGLELPNLLPFHQSRVDESGLLRDNMVAPEKGERDTSFQTVLGTKSLENKSNFFSMGAFTKAGLKCKVKDIYQNPTIDDLTLFFGGTISQESPNGIETIGRSASSSTAAQVPTEEPLITTPAPTTEAKIQMAFKEILGDRQFSMDASFFSMGVLTKAGFTLKVKDIYQNPTIIALANFLDPSISIANNTSNGKSQMVSNLRANEDWFNQGHIIRLNKKHTYEDFQRAWSNIVEVHPMLRLVVAKSAKTNHTHFLRKHLSSMKELPEELSKLQSCLNLSSGRICAVGGFHIGDELYCAIFAHHLAVDVVSWHVIWSDLDDLLHEWAEYLSKKRQIAEQIPARSHARKYSSFLTMEQIKRLPENIEASGSFMNVNVDVSSLNLRREDTEPVDMMLAGLVLALIELHFESHGRDLELEEFDLTRTVGWFTRSVNDFTTMVQQARKNAMSNVNLASAIETAPRARTSSYTSFENRFSILDIECSLTHEGQLDIGIRQLLDSWSYFIRSMADELALGHGASWPPTKSLGISIDHSTYSIPKCMQDQKDAIEESIVAWKLNAQDIEKMAPATDGQAAMLLASLGSRSYMHSYNYEASGIDTDVQLLQHAWGVVLGRHSIFRTIFMPLSPQATQVEKSHQSDIQLVQVILKSSALPTPLVQTGKQLKPMQPGFAKQLCRLHIHKSPTTQKVICTWTCHHALIDGFSMRLVLDEVRAVYIGQALAPQITQFSDIVVSRYEKGRQDTRSNNFWQLQMRDVDPCILVNPLQANKVQTEMQKAIHETLIDTHQHFSFPVSPKQFKDAAHYNHTTVPILFHAAWALTLSTYLSTREVVFGSVVSGRRGEEDIERIQNVVGPCLNTVPLRVFVDMDQNMSKFIEHVTSVFLDMAEHEDLLSLKQIQSLSGKKTLFNSTLITNTPRKSKNMAQPGFHLTLIDMDEVTDVPLLLNMSCEDNTIVHVADARCDTIRPLQTMDLLEADHHRMIDGLVSGPRFPIEYDGLTCSQLLQRRVSRSPDQSAVELYQRKGQKPVVLTYKVLSTLVELGAKRLRAEVDLRPKSRVAIFLDKSTELICAMHAIHRADCAYVALDIDNPAARTKLLIEQIGPSAIICSKHTLKLLPQTFFEDDKCPFIVAEQLFSPATQSSDDSYYLPPSTATPDDVAAILFTSGTTGTPKAVIMPHRQVVGYGVMMAEAIGYSSNDRVFNFARLVFDVSQSDIFGAIYSGATLVLAPQAETVSRLPSLLRESGTTSLNTTPSIASLLYPDSLPLIRSLCLAGDLGAYDSNGEIVYHSRKDRSGHTAGCELNNNMAQMLANLEAHAHQMLPNFMIPKYFIPISAIPLTGNSKVDQLKLHEIYKQWKTQRSIVDHSQAALTLRSTTPAPEKTTYGQQLLPQEHRSPQDIDWSLRDDDWDDYLLPYFDPNASPSTQPRRQIFAFFAITGTSKQHSVLAPYLPSFNLIGVENIFFHQPDHYNSLQAMAVEHCALLRRLQPIGPYLLVGFSFAGQLAYEVANELRQSGEDDVRVVLIDSAARERAPMRPDGVTDAECERFFKVPTTLEATKAGPEVIEYRRYLLNQIRHNISLHNEYVPRPFDGNALIIPRLPNQGEAWDSDETNGYGEFVPQARLQIRTVTAADHFAVMEEEQALRKIGQFIEEFMIAF